MTTVLAPPDDEPATPTASRWRRLGLAAPAYLPALMIAIGGWQHRWMDEDAFINLRIVDQIFAGHGPVFNAGERVEASTSTLWIVVLVIGRAIFGAFTSMEWITLLASLAAAVAAFVVAGKADAAPAPRRRRHRRSRRPDPRRVGRGRLGLLDVGPRDGTRLAVDRGGRGTCSCRRRGPMRSAAAAGSWFGVVLGLAPLVRPDLTLMMICFLVAWFVLVRPRRIVVRSRSRSSRCPSRTRSSAWATTPRSCPRPRSPRTRAGCISARAGRTRRTSSGRTGCGSPRSSIAATIVVPRSLAHRDRRARDRHRGDARGRLRCTRSYITAIGGDYMHGRLLLPAFFALALPASIAVPRRRAPSVVTVGVTAVTRRVWAIVSVVAFRPPPNTHLVSPQPDQRLPRRVGRQAPPERHAVRPQRQPGRRAVRPGRARLLQGHRQAPAARASTRTRSSSRSARSAFPRTTPGRAGLGRRHRRARRTARGAHRARSRPPRRPPQADRRRVVRRALRRDHEQPEGRGGRGARSRAARSPACSTPSTRR